MRAELVGYDAEYLTGPYDTEEEFDVLPHFKKAILTCNVIGCKNMVCTHGMLCIEHTQKDGPKENNNIDRGTDFHC